MEAPNAETVANISNLLLHGSPNSTTIGIVEKILILEGIVIGITEVKGLHLNYAKLIRLKSLKIPSRIGLFLSYLPPFLVCMVALILTSGDQMNPRLKTLEIVLNLHFSKRLLEVLFLHRYSGGMGMDTLFATSISYALYVLFLFLSLQKSVSLRAPLINLFVPGILLFFFGMSGNFYHHYLLARLRKKGEKGYSVPQGGLFRLVVCPHYLFDIMQFLGVAFISQTGFSFCVVLTMFLASLGRSIATRRWDLEKFEDFPAFRKALIPFII